MQSPNITLSPAGPPPGKDAGTTTMNTLAAEHNGTRYYIEHLKRGVMLRVHELGIEHAYKPIHFDTRSEAIAFIRRDCNPYAD